MKHFNHLTEEEKKEIFFIKPNNFNSKTPKELLSIALGASLYTPATHPNIAEDIISNKYPERTTSVLDLEDAIGKEEVEKGIENIIYQFSLLKDAILQNNLDENNIPLIFLRVRNVEQFKDITLNYIEKLNILTGFIFPKVDSINVGEYFKTLLQANVKTQRIFYGMPIIETSSVMFKESRIAELTSIRNTLNLFKDLVLNVRIGGTDFSGIYGIRRNIDTTIYDIQVVRDCIADILNFFGRKDNYYVCSGVVWEYFNKNKHRMLKPELRTTPFNKDEGGKGQKQRYQIVENAIDGLIKEIILDKANGIIGKTVIHPSHICYVNALQTVTREEYEDALSILNCKDVGVHKSQIGNKMNEVGPHHFWATQIINKSKIYGVLNYNQNYNKLFE